MLINKKSKIFIAGHNGMAGSAILRYLKKKNYLNLIVETKKKLNLLDQKDTEKFLKKTKPKCVIIAAARVGGIYANQNNKANFIYENIMIQTNLIHASFKAGVKKLIFLGSSCIYPKYSKQPIKETELLTGKLEPTNDAYAIAKIAGIKMCEAYNAQHKLNYICLMPTNMYGPNDSYDTKNSHFYPALIKKIFLAKKQNKRFVTVWGNGESKREVMFVDDLAHACEFFLRKKVNHTLINIGTGQEKKIKDFYKFIMKKFNCKFKLIYDKSKPNGTPRKMLDTKVAKSYGWQSSISLDKGFRLTLEDFIKNKKFKQK